MTLSITNFVTSFFTFKFNQSIFWQNHCLYYYWSLYDEAACGCNIGATTLRITRLNLMTDGINDTKHNKFPTKFYFKFQSQFLAKQLPLLLLEFV
jgi:hypothetical protein